MDDTVKDTRGRRLRDLRISVTDRCNFRCGYCMPKDVFGKGYKFLASSALLEYAQLERLVRIFTHLGVSKIRLTGGEPLLAWQRLYIELFEHPRMKDLKNVTFETNTTQPLHSEFYEYLNTQNRFEVTWSCSPKLSVSGEPWETAILPVVAHQYSTVNGSDIYFKFVVATADDFEEVTRAVEAYRERGIECPVYLMPLGGRSEEYNLNVKEVAEACMERGWRFTPRLHISLFGNAWGT